MYPISIQLAYDPILIGIVEHTYGDPQPPNQASRGTGSGRSRCRGRGARVEVVRAEGLLNSPTLFCLW